MLQRVLKRLSDKKKVAIFIIVYYLIFFLLQVPKSLKVFYIVHFIEEGEYRILQYEYYENLMTLLNIYVSRKRMIIYIYINQIVTQTLDSHFKTASF